MRGGMKLYLAMRLLRLAAFSRILASRVGATAQRSGLPARPWTILADRQGRADVAAGTM